MMMGETDRRMFMKMTTLAMASTWSGGCMSASNQTPRGSGVALAANSASGGRVPLAPPDRQPAELDVPEPVKRKIGFAIVGLGELAVGQILPAFGESRLSAPVALVSGHPDKARKLAEVYGIDPRAVYTYQDYERLADNNKVDAVYIVLPNSMHAEYTVRGLKLGKHVLCEKPMAVTVDECEQMIDASRQANRKLMIAYRLHYEPYNRKAMELCRQQAIGKLKCFSSSNCQTVQAPNIRLSRELGGGPVGDVGVYSINAARYTLQEEPIEVNAVAHQPKDDPRFREVPETVVYTLRYPSGAIAHCESGFGHGRSEYFRVVGAEGFIEMDPAFGYHGQRLYVQSRSPHGGQEKQELVLQPVNQFAAEMDHFSECILAGKTPHTTGEMGMADMRIVTAVHEAARTGRTVKLS